MQETEVNEKFDTNLLGIPGYALELESNDLDTTLETTLSISDVMIWKDKIVI